ncbi:Protein serine/threonine phosphatase PrpC, regulation of stationary phase [Desulfovibrio sp. DV]|uniref:PP2C family protein-serine/threonine phosphatase n=1 Tax=Desulfovibrio sp. DV TaxID=1844708 RepID=UPI000964726D|nr:protein phosphatase 2C domain-containing protein [Desulfovibrio sp. DV]OLN30394.1 Protein serine/threonine phosphatase PrpC, regulation of stationary phase [Desulfovibrio sp. DV]
MRENNEDAFWIDVDQGLFLVADGMGGLAAGEVASRMAVTTVARFLTAPSPFDTREYAPPGTPTWLPASQRFRRAISEANKAMLEASKTRFGSFGASGMGSTLVGLYRCDDGLIMANVGDSRAYQYRGGSLRQVSEDHSLVMAQVRQGLLSPQQAAHSPERHIIYRALGMSSEPQAEFVPIVLEPGDLYLLCSDGLTDAVDDAELARILSQAGADGPQHACRQLITAALDRQAQDNVTVVLVGIAPDWISPCKA